MKSFVIAICTSAFALHSVGVAAQLLPVPETEQSRIEYKTVADALAALRVRPGIALRVQGGWTIATDPQSNTIWSFVPTGHPAYPAVVKRHTFERDGSVLVGMDVLCQARKEPCDNLVREFQQLNARLSESMRQKAQQGAPADVPASRPRR